MSLDEKHSCVPKVFSVSCANAGWQLAEWIKANGCVSIKGLLDFPAQVGHKESALGPEGVRQWPSARSGGPCAPASSTVYWTQLTSAMHHT